MKHASIPKEVCTHQIKDWAIHAACKGGGGNVTLLYSIKICFKTISSILG